MNSAYTKEPLTVYMGKGKLWILAGSSLIFVAIGGWVLSLYMGGDGTLFHALIGVICVLFFGACLFFIIAKMLDHTPAVILDEQGITDRSSFTAGGMITWEEIGNIKLYRISGQIMIGIELKDPVSYLEKQEGFKGRLMKINYCMVQAPVNISPVGLRIPLSQLYGEMMSRWELHRQIQ